MSNVTETSRAAFYKHVLSGRATSQKDRIMRYILQRGEPVCRNEIDEFFNPRMAYNAKDGTPLIPWNSMTAAVAGMVCRITGCSHNFCNGYLIVSHTGRYKDNEVEFLVPIDEGEKWRERRLF